ncbi:MAG TPA: glycosyltransferase [Terriglobales bacterium]|nr:glycosyltransferase [Terriglobales bacterium]
MPETTSSRSRSRPENGPAPAATPGTLRILHVIPSVAPISGGPAHAVVGMARALMRRGAVVNIATTDLWMPAEEPVPLDSFTDWRGVPTIFFRHQTPPHLTFSWGLTRWLGRHVRDYDAVHIHTVFSWATTPASHYAWRAGVPYIIRPLGTLDRYSLSRSWLRKRIYLWLLDRRNLQHASALHFTSELEQREVAELGLRTPGTVIPLGVEEPQAPSAAEIEAFRQQHNLQGQVAVLSLGRIDPKKGIDTALEAVAALTSQGLGVRYLIAGSGQPQYEAQLRELASRPSLAGRVEFLGNVAGREKALALAAADVFLLPSLDENFGVAAAEALAAGVPLVISGRVGIASLVSRADAGVVTGCDVVSVTAGLLQLLQHPERRRLMGENGRRLAREYFDWDVIAELLESLYRRVMAETAARRGLR